MNKFEYRSICNLGVYKNTLFNLDIENTIKNVYYYKNNYPPVSNNSSRGGYMSDNDLQKNPIFSPLVKSISDCAFPLHSKSNLKITSMWVNITSFSNYNAIHNHRPTPGQISGVLYLKVPQNSGDIVFLNPLDLSTKEYITPKEKDILFFDSFIPHMVEPNLSQEDRISIAFNFNYVNE